MTYDDNRIIIAGYKGGGGGGHRPVETPEGIIIPTGRVLTKTKVQTLDLLCEGEIEGLVTGYYIATGVIGQVGWSGVTFIPNTAALGSSPPNRFLQSIYWNETPVAGKDGKYNFQQIDLQYVRGTPNGMGVGNEIVDELTISRPIQERLRGGGQEFAKVYRIVTKDCIGVEVNIRLGNFSATSTRKKTYGDINPTSVDYSIYYRPVFANKPGGEYLLGAKDHIFGKVNYGYIRSTRFYFVDDFFNDDFFLGWEVKIVRDTEDSLTTTMRNQTNIDSITELYGSKFIYPHSAIVASNFDAEYFTRVPDRVYDTKLLKVKIPDNYDPVTKRYDETYPWSGTFKMKNVGQTLVIDKKWTDNPAWCYYDLLTNKRYGLGNYIDEDYVDKFTLYDIAKYCDTMVSDGYGNVEPRFTCNLYITSQQEAYRAISMMANIFNAITYYSAGQIYVSQDSLKDPVFQFTNANVVNGEFNYSSRARKEIHSIATVRFNDKNNLYKPAIEYVEDIDSIIKYGFREIDLPAYGCTSRGQAIRLGRAVLLAESFETEAVTFQAGLEASFLKPGYIFQIYDANRKAQRLGGRLNDISVSPTSTTLTLDSKLPALENGLSYRLCLLTPTYFYDTSLVSGLTSQDITGIHRNQLQYLSFSNSNLSLSNDKTVISVNSPIDYTNYNVSGKCIWLLESTGNIGNISSTEWQSYKVANIREAESNTYEIEAIEYHTDKFAQIESGFYFTDSVINPTIQFGAPSDLDLKAEQITTHSKLIRYEFVMNDLTNISSFKVITKADSDFSPGDELGESYTAGLLPAKTNVSRYSGTYLPSRNGLYYFRAYSIGTNGLISSAYAANSINITDVNPLLDITLSSLKLSDDPTTGNYAGTTYTGRYYEDSPSFDWQIGIQGIDNLPTDLSHRITFRAPSNSNEPSNEIYYEVTGYTTQNTEYTFDFINNYRAISTNGRLGPFRDYDVVVEAHDALGNSSAGGSFDRNSSPKLDSLYTSKNGYDIFYANNPKPIAYPLWTGDTRAPVPGTNVPFYSTGRATQQWITSDGEIKIFFSNSGSAVPLSGFFEDDIAGGTVYFSPALGTNITGWSNIRVESDDNPLIVPAELFGVSSQYIAIAPYDNFDVAIAGQIPNYLVTGLNISPPVKIKRAGLSTSYRAWVEFSVNGNNNEATDWRQTSYNISDMTTDDFNQGYIEFEEPLVHDNFAIIYSCHQRGAFMPSVRDEHVPIFIPKDIASYPFMGNADGIGISDRNGIALGMTWQGLKGMYGSAPFLRFFIGVLQND